MTPPTDSLPDKCPYCGESADRIQNGAVRFHCSTWVDPQHPAVNCIGRECQLRRRIERLADFKEEAVQAA